MKRRCSIRQIQQYSVIAVIIFLFTGHIGGNDPLSAQPVQLHTSLDTNKIKIGQWAHYTITATHDTGTIVNWPFLGDTLKDLAIVNKTPVDSSLNGNLLRQKRTIAVTSFDSGYYVIPPVLFSYRSQGSNELDTIKTQPTTIRVHTVPVDTSKAIRPIKGPKDVPYTLAELWPYILGAILIISLLILGYYLYRRWQQKPGRTEQHVPEPERPAHEIAFERLKELEDQKLWQKGKVKQYYIELSEILREYIERRYNFQALEMTTFEILEQMENSGFSVALHQKAKDVLELSDFVKFAKHIPKQDDHQEALDKTYAFVRETMPKPEPEQEDTPDDESTKSEEPPSDELSQNRQ